MFEREEDQEKSIEEVWAITQEAIQSVLRGEVGEVKLFREGSSIVEFYPVPGIGGEMAKEIIKKLAKNLGVDLTRGEVVSYDKRPNPFAPDLRKLIVHHPSTRLENIVMTTEDIGPLEKGYLQVTTLGIKHLRPKKSKIQEAGERARQFVSRISRLPWPS